MEKYPPVQLFLARELVRLKINWKSCEIFSEAALANFCDEIDTQSFANEKNKF